jgi:hypothetical protein
MAERRCSRVRGMGTTSGSDIQRSDFTYRMWIQQPAQVGLSPIIVRAGQDRSAPVLRTPLR